MNGQAACDVFGLVGPQAFLLLHSDSLLDSEIIIFEFRLQFTYCPMPETI